MKRQGVLCLKVLVMSDSHGAVHFLRRIIEKEPEAELVFFLGDGLSDIDKMKTEYPHKRFICVKGNNDSYHNEAKEAYKYIDGVTIMACHGDTYSVRVSLRDVISKTASVRGNLVLYGHTHKRDFYNDYSTGICAVNPGAVCDGNYCILDISKGQFEYYPKNVF